MEAIRGCALGRPSARDPSVRQIRVSRASDGASRARGVRSKGGTGTSALQRMGWGAKRPGARVAGSGEGAHNRGPRSAVAAVGR